jgi:anti-sigma B factor antagonist
VNATQYDDYRPFEVHVSSGPDELRVAPAGEVDLATAGLLRKRIDALLEPGCARLVLDLRDVSFMDSTGVRLVLELTRAAQSEPWDLSVVHVPNAVHRVFELSGVLDAVPLGEPEVV